MSPKLNNEIAVIGIDLGNSSFCLVGPGSALHRCQRSTFKLFDQLVGAQQNRWGHDKAERRGGLAVHEHLELGRELHREIARLLAAQDAIDIVAARRKISSWSTP
jgi:hypothetical protein